MRPQLRARSAIIQARREHVAALLARRYSYRQMSRELGVSVSIIAGDVKAVFAVWAERQFVNVKDQALLDLGLLDDAIRSLMPDVLNGSVSAVTALVKVLERRAKMLGYDAPSQVDMSAQVVHRSERSEKSTVEMVRRALNTPIEGLDYFPDEQAPVLPSDATKCN